jgi:hypothetical protein
MTRIDYQTLMPLHHAAVAALEAGEDPKAAVTAFARAFAREDSSTAPATVFLSVLFVAACSSPLPGALQTLLDTNLIQPGRQSGGPIVSYGTLMTHSAIRALHPAQVDAFAAFVAQDMAVVQEDPKGPTAWDWFNWATHEKDIEALCLAFGLSHNLKSNMDPDRDGPFTVYPQPRDSAQRAAVAALALANRNQEG